jgi:hypothetical protein
MTYQSKEPNYIARREEQGLTVVYAEVNPTKETEPTEEESDAVPEETQG